MKEKDSLLLMAFAFLFIYSSVNAQVFFGEKKIIFQSEKAEANSVYAEDFDGDGDLDVLSFSSDNIIFWYENSDGLGTFKNQHVITESASEVVSVHAADIDGDGDQDVLLATSDNKIAWYENIDGNGLYEVKQVITEFAIGIEFVYAADIDGDGDQDVLSTSFFENENIAWYENSDGLGTYGEQQIISSIHMLCKVHAADIDGDGDLDVLSDYGYSKLAWFENTDGNGTFGDLHKIISVYYPRSVYAADIDNDGDQDVLSASDVLTGIDYISWHENVDGNGTFETHNIDTSWVADYCNAFPIDIDGDGDIDALASSRGDNIVAWYENTDGLGTFGEQQIINIDTINGAYAIFAADIDGDGDQDVLSASDIIVWFENLSSVSNESLVQDAISIYPNPTRDILYLELPNTISSRLEIFTISGYMILNKEIYSISDIVDLSGFPGGIYIVRLINNEVNYTERIIISR